jgi:hypothetical protein
MNIASVPALLDATVVAFVAGLVSGLLLLLDPLLRLVPGLRPEDATRSPLLRALLFLLTVAGLVGLAWTQGVVIPRADLPMLLLAATGGSGATHLVYTATKAKGANEAANDTTRAGTVDTVALAAVQATVQAATPGAVAAK